MKKIVIDARESGTSTGRYVDKLIENLHTLKSEFEIVLLTKPHRVSFYEKISPDFRVMESPFKEFTWSEQIGFLKQINSLKPDLVHFTKTEQPAFYKGDAITTIHDLTTMRFYNPAKNWLVFTVKVQVYKWLIKRVAKKSVRILTGTEYVRQDVADYTGITPDKITVTYESADKIHDEPEVIPGLIGKEFILYVGRPQPHKNLQRLIDAFVVIKKGSPTLHLVLAGKKDKAYGLLEAYVRERGVADVVFTDFVSEGQLRWLYEHAKAYVFPSLSEGFGLPPLEAMHHGLPVISSNATCLPEVYRDAAIYFEPTDVDDMAQKVSALLADQAMAKKLAQAGSELVKTYSWKRMAEQTLEVYRQSLAETSGPR